MGSYSYNRPPNEGVTDSLETAGQRQKAARAASPISSATDRLALQPAGQDVGITTKCLRIERVPRLFRAGTSDDLAWNTAEEKGASGEKQFKMTRSGGRELAQVTAAVSVGSGALQVSSELQAWLGCMKVWLHPPTMV